MRSNESVRDVPGPDIKPATLRNLLYRRGCAFDRPLILIGEIFGQFDQLFLLGKSFVQKKGVGLVIDIYLFAVDMTRPLFCSGARHE